MVVTKRKKRKSTPIRFNKAREDASLGRLRNTIEKKFGLPKGCVSFVNPKGRKLHSDTTVTRLKAVWKG